MREILDNLVELKETQGTNAKMEKFRQINDDFKNNVLWELTLRILFDPSISTKLAKKKMMKEVSALEVKNEYTDIEFLEFLINKCSGKDKDIAVAQEYINRFEDEYKDILFEIITQTLSIGMDYRLVNKSIGYSFIEVVKPMLALNWDKMNDKDKKERYAVTIKLDGFRILVFCYNDGTRIGYSRNGLKLEGFDDFINKLALPSGYVYDGELLPSCTDGIESKEQYKAISKIARTKGNKDPNSIRYNIFDCISINDYENETSKPYHIRRGFLNKHVFNTPYQRVVPVIKEIDFETDYEWLCDKLDEVVSKGEEGLMLNKINSLYTFKRGRDIFKIKKFHTCDLKVIGIEEGEGKYKERIGSLIVDYKGNNLGVGSGLSDDFREYYYKNQDEIIGKIVEVSYFEETKNDKDGSFSLRFPIFQEIRDKKEVSYE